MINRRKFLVVASAALFTKRLPKPAKNPTFVAAVVAAPKKSRLPAHLQSWEPVVVLIVDDERAVMVAQMLENTRWYMERMTLNDYTAAAGLVDRAVFTDAMHRSLR